MRRAPALWPSKAASSGSRGGRSLVDRLIEHPIHSAVQDITAVAATADTAHRLGCQPGVPVLRIERLYRDRELLPVELAVNHFHPDRYSYRLQLRGR